MTAIAAGNAHTVALKSDGTVWAWGDNSSGQLGDGTTTDSAHACAGERPFGHESHCHCGRPRPHGCPEERRDGMGMGQTTAVVSLETGLQPKAATPVQASGLSGMTMTAIAAGEAHTVALKSDRTVWTWGANSSGQLGHGGTTNKTKPVQVGSLSDVTAIAAGSAHTVALKKDGTVRAWGDNSSGQLGHGDNSQKNSPVDVKKLSDVMAIAAGNAHTVAVKNDGTIWAWGSNSNGQLGDGTTTDANIRVEVSGLSGAIAITAGYQHTVAIKK